MIKNSTYFQLNTLQMDPQNPNPQPELRQHVSFYNLNKAAIDHDFTNLMELNQIWYKRAHEIFENK